MNEIWTGMIDLCGETPTRAEEIINEYCYKTACDGAYIPAPEEMKLRCEQSTWRADIFKRIEENVRRRLKNEYSKLFGGNCIITVDAITNEIRKKSIYKAELYSQSLNDEKKRWFETEFKTLINGIDYELYGGGNTEGTA